MLATARNTGMVLGVGLAGALFSLFSQARTICISDRLTGEVLHQASFVSGTHTTFIVVGFVAIAAAVASLTKGKVKTEGMLEGKT